MKAWLGETHDANFELVRHFLKRTFDSELAAAPGQWRKAAIGLMATLLPAALLAYPTFLHRYGCVATREPRFDCPAIGDYAAQYSRLVHVDASWLICLAICLTAMATALQWQSLFPSRRDVLALAGFPVSPRQIFAARFAALVAAFAAFAVALSLLPAILFAQVTASPWQANPSLAGNVAANFAAFAAACAFAFFSLLALQGAMLMVLPARWFARLSVVVQAALFTASVAALPFAWREPPASGWWPVNWFLALRQGDIRASLAAVALAALLAVLTYLAGYYRYSRLLLEAPRGKRQEERAFRPGSRALEILVPDPRQQAVFAFLWKTLIRSRTHQLVLQAVAGLAAAWIVQSVEGGARGMEAAVVLAPLAAGAFLIVGMRYLFSLPAELRANWLFQITEREGRMAWLRATDRFVICCVLAPVYLCAAPVAVAVSGPGEAARLLFTSFVLVLALFEFWFRDWRKLPFTCSHLPGQRPFWLMLTIGMGVVSYLGTAAAVVIGSNRGWVAFAAGFPLACGLWLKLRQRRRRTWEETAVIFEQQEAAAVESLGIRFELGLENQAPEVSTLEPAARPATPFWNSFREKDAPTGNEAFPGGDRAVSPFFALGGLWEDTRYGLRLMRKNLGLSAAVTITLALGIGVNVAVLTLINGLAFRARVDQPETIVQISFAYTGQGMGIGRVSPQQYAMYRDRTRSLQSLAAFAPTRVLLGQDRSSEAAALLVSCNFFEVYHLRQAKLGRLFAPGECATPGGAPVAVLSEEAWRGRFGSDPHIVGQAISIGDQPFTVVGIAPAHHPARINHADVWIPYTTQPLLDPAHDMFRGHSALLIASGRLAPGVSRSTAQAEWDVMVQQQEQARPGHKNSVAITDGSAISNLTSGAARFYALFALLMGAPWAVLLITCANVTTMLLSRAVARRREIAVRLSLGAPRMRLLRMLLTESCLLAVAAGSAALFIAYRVPGPLFQFLTGEPADFPIAPDWRIFVFVSSVVAVTGCLAGLAPALESLKVDLTASLKGYLSCNTLTAGIQVRSLLVSAQVALGLVLMVCAGLVSGIDPQLPGGSGLDARRTLVTPIHFPARSSRESSLAMYRNLETHIASLPGVQSIAYAADAPFLGVPLRLQRPAGDTDAAVSVNPASPGYLKTLGIPILQGRDFQEADRPSASPVLRAIVSQSFARLFLPNQLPVGQHFESGPSFTIDIIGIAQDVNTGSDDQLAAYVLADWSARATNLLIRVSGDPQAAASAIRGTVRAAYADFLVTPNSLQTLFDDRDRLGHHLALLLLSMAAVAVLLAVAGIYGVVSFTVSQRTRELGIRVALGARSVDIVREVLITGLKPVGYGLFAGVWLSLIVETAVRQTFSAQPLRFDTGNPAIYAAAALLLGAAAVAAMLPPARRGAKSDPLESLRYE